MKNLLLIIAIMLVCLISCTSSYEDMPEMPNDQEYISERYISEKEAYQIALNGYRGFWPNTASRYFKNASIRLYNSTLQSRELSEVQDTSFYIVNFLDGGFVVVAAKRDVANPIFGISETGSFDYNDNANLQYYMNLGKSYYETNSSFIKFPITPTFPLVEYDTASISYINRYVPTKWGQKSPYNYYCPIVEGGTTRSPTGCAPVAMAQIMAFHRYPDHIIYDNKRYELNWDQMLLCNNLEELEYVSSVGVDEVQRLLYICGQLADCEYQDTITISTLSKAAIAFQELNYSAIDVDDPTMNECLNSLRNYGPIMMGSTSAKHAWVVDAAKTVVLSSDGWYGNEPIKIYMAYHYFNMNWGARGAYDGFYLVPEHLDSMKSPINPEYMDRLHFVLNINPL